MTKREQFNLIFNFRKMSTGEVVAIVRHKFQGTDESNLTFIESLTKHEAEAFIHDMERCLRSQGNVDEGFFSDSVAYLDISYQYPNVVIDDAYTIPMIDMKELLEEWLEFMSS